MKSVCFMFLLAIGATTAYTQETRNEGDTLVFINEPTPSYPGGLTELGRFIIKNLKYPAEIAEQVEPRVYVGFVVNEDGSLSDLEILKGSCEQCNTIVLEVFRKMPKWIPARRDGKPIKVKMVYPIIIELEK